MASMLAFSSCHHCSVLWGLRRLGGGLARGRPPAVCSPRTSAYSSAIQYTGRVTTTEITSTVVDAWPPTVPRIAAVMMAPYIPEVRRRPRFPAAGPGWAPSLAAMLVMTAPSSQSAPAGADHIAPTCRDMEWLAFSDHRLSGNASGLFVRKPSTDADCQRRSIPGPGQTVRGCPLAPPLSMAVVTVSLGRSRAGRERLLSPHAFRVCAAGSRVV